MSVIDVFRVSRVTTAAVIRAIIIETTGGIGET